MDPVTFEIDDVMRTGMQKPAEGKMMQYIPGVLDNFIRNIHAPGVSVHGSSVVAEVLVSLR